jgi:phage/plasmid-like protein (TIGR03299 family)
MSHEFNSGMFVKDAAWHGLGTVVEDAPTTAEAIKLAGMDWTVEEQPMISIEANGDMDLVEGYKKLRRSDTKAQLHVCKDTWTPFQNSEAFSFFDPLIQDGDAKLEAAVSLKGGKRIAITAKLSGGTAEVVKGDPVEPYLVLCNSHDGSLSLGLMFSNVRVVCSNTLGSALAEQKHKGTYAKFQQGQEIAITDKMIRLRHTANIRENLSIVQQAIDISRRQFNLSIESYKAMAAKSMTTDLFRAYLTNVFADDLKVGTPEERKITDYIHYEKLVSNFESGIGMDIPGVRGTAWAGFQAVTEFATHQRGGDDTEAARERLNQMWFGSGAKLIDRAQSEILSLV